MSYPGNSDCIPDIWKQAFAFTFNMLYFPNTIVAWISRVATQIWVNFDPGNSLSTDGTKSLSEPILAYHQQGPIAFIWEHYDKRSDDINQ